MVLILVGSSVVQWVARKASIMVVERAEKKVCQMAELMVVMKGAWKA